MGSVDMKWQADGCSVVRASTSEVQYTLDVRPPQLLQCGASLTRPAKLLLPLLESEPYHRRGNRETFSPKPAYNTFHYAARHFADDQQPPLRT